MASLLVYFPVFLPKNCIKEFSLQGIDNDPETFLPVNLSLDLKLTCFEPR